MRGLLTSVLPKIQFRKTVPWIPNWPRSVECAITNIMRMRQIPLCNHTFCSNCILELINRNEKKCPSCRNTFTGIFPKDFYVNSAAVNNLNLLQAKSPSNEVTSPKISKKLKSKYEKMNNNNIKSFTNIKEQLQVTIKQSKDWKGTILKSHNIVKEEIANKLQKLEEASEEKVKYLDMKNEFLESQLKEVGGKILQLKDIQRDLDSSKTLNADDEDAQEFEETNTSLQSWIEEFNLTRSREDKLLNEFEKNVKALKKKVGNIREILQSLEMEEKSLDHHLKVLSLKNSQGKITLMQLQNMNSSTKDLLSHGRVFSVYQLENERIIGRVSLERDKLMFHCLKNQELPPKSYTVNHSDVMYLANLLPKRAFLEFGTDQSNLGKVFIKLKPDSRRVENFVNLCMGQTGSSYLNTVILKVLDKGKDGERVHCGDYQFNNGRGGKAVVAGAGNEEGGAFEGARIIGSVYGLSKGGVLFKRDPFAAQFGIITQGKSTASSATIFGTVVSGLHVINSAIYNYPRIKDVKIADCGIVLLLYK